MVCFAMKQIWLVFRVPLPVDMDGKSKSEATGLLREARRLLRAGGSFRVVVGEMFFFFSENDSKLGNTLPEINIAPENRPSQKESSLPTSNHPFSGAMLVAGRVPSLKLTKNILKKRLNQAHIFF